MNEQIQQNIRQVNSQTNSQANSQKNSQKDRAFSVVFILIMASGGASSMTSCQATPAHAPRNLSQGLREFPSQDLLLTENRLFLWRADLKGDQVETVLRSSAEMDALTSEKQRLEGPKSLVEKDLAPYTQAVDPIQTRLGELNFLINRLKSQEKKEKDPEKKKKITEQITTLEEERRAKNDEKVALDLKFETSLKDRKDLEAQSASLKVRGEAAVAKIKESVDLFYNFPPSSIRMAFLASGAIDFSIQGWNPHEAEVVPEFSTANHLVQNVDYQSLGGVLTFDVLLPSDSDLNEIRETYSFRMVRIKYAASDGRVYYSGEFTRKMNPSYCERMEREQKPEDCQNRIGSAKFAGSVLN